MKINYELTTQDYIDFNMHFTHNSETVKKSLFIQRYIAPIIFLIVPFFIKDFRSESFKFSMGVFFIMFLLWIGLYKKHFDLSIKRRLSKFIKEGNISSMLGKKTLELSHDEIVEISNGNRSSISWDSVYKIAETDKHIFIYIDSMQAFIIPVKFLENKQEFLAALNSRCKDIDSSENLIV